MKLTPYQNFIFLRSYSRFDLEKGRRETWDEAVDRWANFMRPRIPKPLRDLFEEAVEAFRNLEVMPSMRGVWSAGPALEKNNAAIYNCAYVPLESPKDLADMMFILMSGGGVGFSVERKYVDKWQPVPQNLHMLKELRTQPRITIVVDDSREGWANSIIDLINLLYQGIVPDFDYSRIRPAGSILKTFGGYASGSEPLKQLHAEIIKIFLQARGRKLKPIELYDIATHIANCVVAGGSRRSATISFSDYNDEEMMKAKDGEFWKEYPNRALSNNTVVFPEGVTYEEFLREFNHTIVNGTGERGFLFEESIKRDILQLHRDPNFDYKLNTCGEVILRPRQFCNLSEIVVRPHDTLETLLQKAKYATLFGILQATFTDFYYLDERWKENSEEERLLGISLTGVRDHPVLQFPSREAEFWLRSLRASIRGWADMFADLFGINRPTSITSIKPSGTVSQLVGTASGIHPRFARYYKRRVIVNKMDPLADILIKQGIEYENSLYNQNAYVFTFYQESPETSIFADEVTALEQVYFWNFIKENYTTHNPSITIQYKPEEVYILGKYIYALKPTGMALLPVTDAVYKQLPFEAITKEEYLEGVKRQNKMKLEELSLLLNTDSGEPGCSGGVCLF